MTTLPKHRNHCSHGARWNEPCRECQHINDKAIVGWCGQKVDQARQRIAEYESASQNGGEKK